MGRNGKGRGFTLVEVMISLAIFAVVSGALVRNASMTVHQTSLVRDRTLAWWVAENYLSEMRSLPREDENFPSIGSSHLSVRMARRDWRILVEVNQTEHINMRRIKISVYEDDDIDAPLITLSSFMGKH
ncbi:MAG: type II secretion system minor pseudopilin GspI [Proteobacteria bacterium]|nr:type II secretion system minor pseudopilin GspI [Pseudomonadota bacterium]